MRRIEAVDRAISRPAKCVGIGAERQEPFFEIPTHGLEMLMKILQHFYCVDWLEMSVSCSDAADRFGYTSLVFEDIADGSASITQQSAGKVPDEGRLSKMRFEVIDVVEFFIRCICCCTH